MGFGEIVQAALLTQAFGIKTIIWKIHLSEDQPNQQGIKVQSWVVQLQLKLYELLPKCGK